MPSDTTRSTEILQRALNAWGSHSTVIEKYALLHEELDGEAAAVLMASLERYIQGQRTELLEAHWGGGISGGTPADAEKITIPPAEMVRINGVTGFYNVNRVILFLYVHAYLFEVLDIPGPWHTLKFILDDIDPR